MRPLHRCFPVNLGKILRTPILKNFLGRGFINRAPTSTQLHPPPPSSIHLNSAHFNLHPAPSTSTQLILASTQSSAPPSAVFKPKYCTQLGNFPKFRSKNQKLSISTENWHTWYIGGVDYESTLRFLKFRPQNPF